MIYEAAETRNAEMPYRRLGKSGVKLPPVSLGLWHNFGHEASYRNCRDMLTFAFDQGITHFDLANNYGPAPGAAEETFGRALADGLGVYRDEMIISTKAGYDMWPGPYGELGSRKYLMASLDQSLKRMGLDYVDIFYHHRPDPDTPLEETMQALADMVRQGKALYVGISNYNAADTRKAVTMLQGMGVRCLIHQFSYSLLNRGNESVIKVLNELGVGSIAFSPLAQGILTGKYRNGIPADSRAGTNDPFLNKDSLRQSDVDKAAKLEDLAQKRGQSLAQMSLAWVLRENGGADSVIIGASRASQIEENLGALKQPDFSTEELVMMEAILA
jgi:L-glyceraldehyde 3-phosphate reductase